MPRSCVRPSRHITHLVHRQGAGVYLLVSLAREELAAEDQRTLCISFEVTTDDELDRGLRHWTA